MASKIDVSKIDEFYPVPGVNQSTQGFRTNFGEIKRNLLTLKGEVTELLDTRVGVSGDAVGLSSTGLGAVGDVSIALTLSPSGVIAGTYDVSSQSLSLAIDGKGRITGVTATARPVLDGTKRGLVPHANNYAGTNSTRSLTIPKLILDQFGNIVDADLVEVGNFTAVGQPLDPGALWIGGDDRKARQSVPPFDLVQGESEYWALCMTPTFPDLLTWRKVPTGIASPVVVAGGAAVDVARSGDTFTASLNVNKLPLLADATAVDPLDTLVLYDTSATATLRVRVSRLLALAGGFLVDEQTPALGADLDARNHYVHSSLGSLRLGKPSTPVLINDSLWPITTGRTAGNVLTVSADGNMSWSPIPVQSGSGNLAQGDGITIAPTGVADARAINLSISKLTAVGTYSGTEYVPMLKSDGTQVRVLLRNFLSGYTNIFAVDPNGNDTSGTGTFENPFKTITRAIAAVQRNANDPSLSCVLVGPGVYTENVAVNKPKIVIAGLGSRESVTIVGTLSVSNGLSATHLNRITVDSTSVDSGSYDAAKRSLNIVGGVDEFIATDCAFYRTVSYDDNMLENITLSGRQNGAVRFVNCAFRGLLNNSLSANGPFGTVEINGVRGNYQTMLGIRHSGARMVVTNAEYLGDVIHTAGILELNGIRNLYGNFSRVISSTANSGKFVLNDTNMLVLDATGTPGVARINKTGTCEWIITGTNRTPAQDTLTGARSLFPGNGVDIGENVVTANATGTFVVNSDLSNTWDLTLTGNTTVTLQSANSTQIARGITVVCRQDNSGSRSVTFTAPTSIVWDSSATQPGMIVGAGKITMYTFLRVGSTWLGTRSFAQG